MLHTVSPATADLPAPPLPPMGPALVLRVLSKRAHRAPPASPGSSGPLHSRFTLPAVDMAHVARYRAALGFAPARADAGAVPLTWWYLPVQRAHMATMLGEDFPYRLAGMVHVENELTAHRAAPPGQPIRLDTRIEVLPPTASGAIYCALETVGSAGGEPVFTCTSKYLAVRGRRSGNNKGQGARVAPADQPGDIIDRWTLAPSSGRAYARVSGDWNPIHLTRWSARLLGLPAPIIHGMHSVARCCAALEAAAGRPLRALSVRFTAPVTLGATAVLSIDGTAGRYTLYADGVPAAEGAYAPAHTSG